MAGSRSHLLVAGPKLTWLVGVQRAVQDAFAVTLVHTDDPLRAIGPTSGYDCVVVELMPGDSTADVRAVLDRASSTRFVFIAHELPLRHAVARVIRDAGHAIVARQEPSVVIAATVAAVVAPGQATR